jgi:DNA-directed RNA polymerase specialized sigma24 family protein
MNPDWEVLPALETRLAPSVLEHPKARQILTAFIQKATKPEIARVFGVKEKTVRSIIEAARSLRTQPE